MVRTRQPRLEIPSVDSQSKAIKDWACYHYSLFWIQSKEINGCPFDIDRLYCAAVCQVGLLDQHREYQRFVRSQSKSTVTKAETCNLTNDKKSAEFLLQQSMRPILRCQPGQRRRILRTECRTFLEGSKGIRSPRHVQTRSGPMVCLSQSIVRRLCVEGQ
jgi:hypothetical protein